MNWYLQVLKKYLVIEGRARRKEYWMFVLINICISFALGFISGLVLSGSTIVTNLYTLAVLIPSITAGIRRMHDTDRSGWWLLFPIVNIVLLCFEGQAGPNRFGADPKAMPEPS